MLVLGHLVAFALALSAVLRGDWMVLRARRIDAGALGAISRSVALSLFALALTGVAIVGIDTGFDPRRIASSPKLLAKLTVVAILALNGVVLHARAFPALVAAPRHRQVSTHFICVAGAVSTTSWMYAAFMGIAKPFTSWLGYAGFMGLYAVALLSALVIASVVVRPRIKALLHDGPVTGPSEAARDFGSGLRRRTRTGTPALAGCRPASRERRRDRARWGHSSAPTAYRPGNRGCRGYRRRPRVRSIPARR